MSEGNLVIKSSQKSIKFSKVVYVFSKRASANSNFETIIAKSTTFAVLVALTAIEIYEADHNKMIMIYFRQFPSFKRSLQRRIRINFDSITQHLSNIEFWSAFLLIMLPWCGIDESSAYIYNRRAVKPAVRLRLNLRILAGGQYHDQMIS